MDYKKKYEDALERCKKEFNFNNLAYSHEEIKERLERVFPELKESEDERRIRKDLIGYFEVCGNRIFAHHRVSDIIAWLEKQGEQKPTDKVEPKFKVGDIVRHKNGDNVTITQIDTQHQIYYYKGWDGAATVHSDFSISEQDNWELVEQKPTWSEEDEKMLKSVISSIRISRSSCEEDDDVRDLFDNEIDWLESLKERMKGE